MTAYKDSIQNDRLIRPIRQYLNRREIAAKLGITIGRLKQIERGAEAVDPKLRKALLDLHTQEAKSAWVRRGLKWRDSAGD